MKTTSSKLFRGVMLIAALAVPATTWWASVRYYQAHQQPAPAVAASPTWAQMYESQRGQMLKNGREGNTVEAVPVVRSTWTGPTDPDNVWHGQLQQANKTLTQHHLPALNVNYSPPSTRRLPGR
jgi:hypothetical protein